jgi:Bacterial regulatory helix-turn-helix protein, lysR family
MSRRHVRPALFEPRLRAQMSTCDVDRFDAELPNPRARRARLISQLNNQQLSKSLDMNEDDCFSGCLGDGDKSSGPLPAPSRNLNVALNQLQHAIAAAEYGSLRQAAEVLSVKQSTLSRSIQLLEHRFGATIFERSSAGVRATPNGRQFLRIARSILEQLDALATITRASGRGEAGRLAIGFCTSLTAGNLRASLLDFRQRFRQIELAIVERRRAHLATALRNGVLDILVVTGA